MLLTRISKVLAVFLAVGSLAFVGFAIATTFGEPDPAVLLRDPVFEGYSVALQPGGAGVWEARRAADGSTVASSKNVYDVMVKVLDDANKRNNDIVTARKATQEALEGKLATLQSAIAQDEQALVDFETKQRDLLEKVREEEKRTISQVITATAEAQKLENAVAKRREDVFRLRQEMSELDVDLYRLQEIERDLENVKVQVQGDLQRATDRNQQLKDRLGY